MSAGLNGLNTGPMVSPLKGLGSFKWTVSLLHLDVRSDVAFWHINPCGAHGKAAVMQWALVWLLGRRVGGGSENVRAGWASFQVRMPNRMEAL